MWETLAFFACLVALVCVPLWLVTRRPVNLRVVVHVTWPDDDDPDEDEIDAEILPPEHEVDDNRARFN